MVVPGRVLLLGLVGLAAALDGAFVVGVEADFGCGFVAQADSVLGVGAGAGGAGGGVGEEEVEEFVGDGEVGLLLELLEGGEAEEGFEEGEGGADCGDGVGEGVGGGDRDGGGRGGLGECEVGRGGGG